MKHNSLQTSEDRREQLSETSVPACGIHTAIIMDGNGRWATARGLSRSQGHREGAKTVRRVVTFAPLLGIHTLTLYAFSSDNWNRPAHEVKLLMRLLRGHLERETEACVTNRVRLEVIGRRDRFSRTLRAAVEAAEMATASGDRMILRLAIDYSARAAIREAAGRFAMRGHATESFSQLLAAAYHAGSAITNVDLLIRTGGEQRLSDFLLWECAYAEFVFSRRMWPEFTETDLEAAVTEFDSRQRRFGRLPVSSHR